MHDDGERPAAILRRLVNGYQVAQAIHVSATLGIADLLAGGPRTSDDLAAATGAHPRSLYRLLRALASVGIFSEADGRRFALTPLGDCLRSDSPESIRGWAAKKALERFPRTTFALSRLPTTWRAVEKLMTGDVPHPAAARGAERGALKLVELVARAA